MALISPVSPEKGESYGLNDDGEASIASGIGFELQSLLRSAGLRKEAQEKEDQDLTSSKKRERIRPSLVRKAFLEDVIMVVANVVETVSPYRFTAQSW